MMKNRSAQRPEIFGQTNVI